MKQRSGYVNCHYVCTFGYYLRERGTSESIVAYELLPGWYNSLEENRE